MKKMSGVVSFAASAALVLSLVACTPPTGTDIDAITQPTPEPTATSTPEPEPTPVANVELPQWSDGEVEFVTLTEDDFVDFPEQQRSEPNRSHILLGRTPPGFPVGIPAPLGRWIQDSAELGEDEDGAEQYRASFWLTADEVDVLVAEFESRGWTVDADGNTSVGRSIIMGSVTYSVILEFVGETEPDADSEDEPEDAILTYTIMVNE